MLGELGRFRALWKLSPEDYAALRVFHSVFSAQQLHIASDDTESQTGFPAAAGTGFIQTIKAVPNAALLLLGDCFCGLEQRYAIAAAAILHGDS